MKDFSTPEYIRPILEEIRGRYYPITDSRITAALRCAVLMQARKGRDAFAVRPGQAFYYYHEATRALYKAVKEYAEAAETEPGKLDQWRYTEEKRIQEATRDALLALYA